MERRLTKRKYPYHAAMNRHLKLEDLKIVAEDLGNFYLSRDDIPSYPRPELWVSHLRHDTTPRGLRGIRSDKAFKAFQNPSGLMWWSLAVRPEEVSCAEEKLLQKTFPDQTPEQAQAQEPFLKQFATSPALIETSRMGPYRFTFSLEEVLEAYSDQVCAGQPPAFRVFETHLYKTEVMYVILVHSPANEEMFSEYPLLPNDPDAVCRYQDGCIIWRPEAMCETHRYERVVRPDEMKIEVRSGWNEFYVWDHVSIALHMDNQLLSFDPHVLRKNLTYCDAGYPTINPPWSFLDFTQAEDLVHELWPNVCSPLERA